MEEIRKDKEIKTIAYSFLIGDLLHYGHIKMLELAKQRSDYHICGILNDSVVDEWISPRICDFHERKAVIENLAFVDEIIEQTSLDPFDNIEKIKNRYPDCKIILLKNHLLGEGMFFNKKIEQNDVEIIGFDFYPKLSRENIAKAFYFAFQGVHDTNYKEVAWLNSTKNRLSELFSTKAETLSNLMDKIEHSKIEKGLIFTIKEWNTNGEFLLDKILEEFKSEFVIVRSSSSNEDSLHSSNAGFFESVLNVQLEKINLTDAIGIVIESYQKVSSNNFEREQVFIQEQTKGVKLSGVVFTRNLKINTPYYLINYDESGQTDSVTGGGASKKIEIFRDASPEEIDPMWHNLLLSVKELENIFQNVALDIEFAITNDDKIVLFQVRPLAANSKYFSTDDILIKQQINKCKNTYANYKKHFSANLPEVYLSDMSFWNPAELIGDRPYYLDYSLFNNLITKDNWSKPLINLGYSFVDSSLCVLIGNKPYVDLNNSFLGLTPEELPNPLKHKLLHFYVNKLKSNPELHDKIEFEIVFNCFHFDLENSYKELLENNFDKEEIKELNDCLFRLTNNQLENFQKINQADIDSIQTLEKLYDKAKAIDSKLLSSNEQLNQVKGLIEECKLLGIPAFVRAARFAFIGTSMLKSLRELGVYDPAFYDEYLASVYTVASELDGDFTKLQNKKISIDTFLRKYGHLRPGTYDITKLPYSNNLAYFGEDPKFNNPVASEKFYQESESITIEILDIYLKKYGFIHSGKEVSAFIITAIQNREYFKFIYTKCISYALELIAEVGERLGFTREELRFLDYYSMINHIEKCNDDEIKEIWESTISSRKRRYEISALTSLPSIVFGENDFVCVNSYVSSPNFITSCCVEGDVVNLDIVDHNTNLTGKVVLIEKADPGYDWIFTHQIKAFITKYGGAASHMAIRCAEFNIPAAIGCGELLYSRLTTVKKIVLDCNNKMITPIY